MRSMARETSTSLRIWLVFLLATVPAAGVSFAGNGPCFSVSVTETFVLPGGAEHPAGTLTVCNTHTLSPVSVVHKTYLDDEHVAMLTSRVGTGEGKGDGLPFLMFHRDASGLLHLYGMAAPDGEVMKNYRLWGGAHMKRRDGAGREKTQQFARAEGAEGTVLLAAHDSNGRQK